MSSAPRGRKHARSVAPPLRGQTLRVRIRGRVGVRAVSGGIAPSGNGAFRPRRKTALGSRAMGIHVALRSAHRRAARSISAGSDALWPRRHASTSRRAVGIDVPSGALDGRAAGDFRAGCRPARPHRRPLDTGSAVRDGRAHRPLIDVPCCPAALGGRALRPGHGPALAVSAAGGVHSAVGGQSEEAVQLAAVQRSPISPAALSAKTLRHEISNSGGSRLMLEITAAQAAGAVSTGLAAAVSASVKSTGIETAGMEAARLEAAREVSAETRRRIRRHESLHPRSRRHGSRRSRRRGSRRRRSRQSRGRRPQTVSPPCQGSRRCRVESIYSCS